MTDLSTHFPLLVDDEFTLLQHLAPSAGAEILDVGCGAGAFTERMATQGGASFVAGIEVDDAQLEKNRQRPWPLNLEFHRSGAEELPFADGSFNGVTLFKSLHHIPTPLLGQAFSELRRVLRPGGWVYISEPAYEGPFNDVMRLFHDEGVVRASALKATEQAVADGLFRLERRVRIFTSVSFSNFDDFRKRMMNPTHSQISKEPALVDAVRKAYEVHQTALGANFIRPVRIDLLVRT